MKIFSSIIQSSYGSHYYQPCSSFHFRKIHTDSNFSNLLQFSLPKDSHGFEF
ncbi:hypothetical protein M5D96_011401, partial [Drosophila gunungcola]